MDQDSIDLDQLAIRESEQIEWKENVADPDNVVATLSAFANDLANLGGGYVICGVRETKDEHGFPVLVREGLTASRLKEVEGVVLTRCRERVSPPITPLVQEVSLPDQDRRVLVFIQPSTGHAQSFRRGNDGAKHFVRISRETREARNGVLRDLLVRKGAQEPWDRRICSGASVNDLDLLALRDSLQRMRVFSAATGVERYLSEENYLSPFVPSLCKREPLTGVLRPRNFAMLLFGRDPQRFIPGAISLFSIYPGRDRADPHAERHEIAGTVIEQARRLSELLDVQSFTTFDKTDPRAPNAVKYPKRALYEAMGNALAHREYELDDPVRITVFDDRIEVQSPGSLPFGVDPERFAEGKAGPRWRNQSLAWFFNRLQIAQAEGQGIPTILRTMQEEGCPPPRFEIEEARVICTLPAHPRYALLRELREVEQDLGLGDFVRAQQGVTRLLLRDPENIRALQLFAEVQTALRDPEPIERMLSVSGYDVARLPAGISLQLSEALLSNPEPTESQRALARRLLTAAGNGRLEERELRRIAVALLRSGEPKGALSVIDRSVQDHPEWKDTASFHQLRGDAYIGLAKRARNTATRKRLSTATRQRAWAQFREYIEKAEEELVRSEALCVDPGLISIIKKNKAYVDDLKRTHIHRSRTGRGRQ
jgi:ATP-dependent DNA helicase RecG